MAEIVFAGKIQKQIDAQGIVVAEYIKIPVLARRHIIIAGFRTHPKYGFYANSTLLFSMLEREIEHQFPDHRIHLKAIPHHVKVDTSQYLAEVTITL